MQLSITFQGMLSAVRGQCWQLVWVSVLALLSSCAAQLDVNASNQTKPAKPYLAEKQYASFDGDFLGYRKWEPKQRNPKMIVIGVHGISGYAGDYDNLGKHFLKQHTDTALYAADTRGQGMDPVVERRGDIRSPKDWYRDLYTFTGLVRKLHPKAKVVWFGESMGSLIVLHAYHHPPHGESKPDALVMASPIIGVDEQLTRWKYWTAKVSAMLMPRLRVSLETLSDGQRPVVTKDDIHEQQAVQNPWYIKQYTLRLLLHLSRMSETLGDLAADTDCPVLVLHGGEDIFTSEERVKQWFGRFPADADATRKLYPDSYHLLMYDHERETIFGDVSDWLRKVK
ncbi:alpha/beta fold hydrolase [Oceaniferula marina]|uniref:alpha/beta fold hydrolase n=1 Tax=Oceaniferula marina TaxID=2748318 RepID=UPI0015C0DD25|nr:alpha/beta fold hydrolase [Oceaniferula marina]